MIRREEAHVEQLFAAVAGHCLQYCKVDSWLNEGVKNVFRIKENLDDVYGQEEEEDEVMIRFVLIYFIVNFFFPAEEAINKANTQTLLTSI